MSDRELTSGKFDCAHYDMPQDVTIVVSSFELLDGKIVAATGTDRVRYKVIEADRPGRRPLLMLVATEVK